MFQSELYIFPLPTCIFTKDVKQEMPASIKQSELFGFSDHVLVLLCLPRSIKGECLLSCALKLRLRTRSLVREKQSAARQT